MTAHISSSLDIILHKFKVNKEELKYIIISIMCLMESLFNLQHRKKKIETIVFNFITFFFFLLHSFVNTYTFVLMCTCTYFKSIRGIRVFKML